MGKKHTTDLQLLQQGLEILVHQDAYLLQNDLNERAITHKLAEKYNFLYPAFDVDCEYNRNLDSGKGIEIDAHEIARMILKKMSSYIEMNNDTITRWMSEKDFLKDETIVDQIKKSLNEHNLEYDEDLELWFNVLDIEGKKLKMKIIPDIIIHERGTHKKNHIVIEAKKSNNLSKEAIIYDLIKLASLVHSDEYKYKMGVFINLPVKPQYSKAVQFESIEIFRDQNLFEFTFTV